ncbi:MAG TPA: PIN domain-containing protein, partial [Trueperaceae bacterium]|nr:PIN domain-containing protein [Trueperaceae bacterium]
MTYLIDTNVLVYGLDSGHPEKKSRAAAWLAYLARRDEGVLSTQALSELSRVCLWKLRPPWTPDEVADHVHALARVFTVVSVTTAVVGEALRGVRDHHLSYFDAQMWAAARLNDAPFLLTENMASGATLDGVS